MKNLWALALGLILLTGCGGGIGNNGGEEAVTSVYEEAARQFALDIIEERYAACIEVFTADMKTALPEEALKNAWIATAKDAGSFTGIEKTEVKQQAGYDTITVYCAFENMGITIMPSYDAAGEVAGLYFNYYQPLAAALELPEGLEEIAVTVGKGSDWELDGKLTRRTDAPAKAAVVLVHGSGSTDMDETIYQNKPFRDIAWGLAAQGVDVLRYDKRTYTYGNTLIAAGIEKLTVSEETIDDAIAAARLLQDKGYERIYLAGHSLGGMLAFRIDQESGGMFAGLVLLAGSPRTLTDIVIDQNAAVMAAMTDQEQIAETEAIVAEEQAKLARLESMSAEEVLTDAAWLADTVFGMPAYYVKDLSRVDTAALARDYDKPVLVLQGGKDFQVYPDKDYVLWQECLADNPEAEFVLYDNLNHLFMPVEGETTGTLQDYVMARTVAPEVINDIASFVLKQ
ncbi:MAG: alpha/beta fold hydrolase [Syntrophomonadaceae bacterium]|nr:alpha/beta fold hydrolase [Syntrophomonadaceae bacterium]